MFEKLKKSFQGGTWSVLYRQGGDDVWRMLESTSDFWYADPFLLYYDDKYYLFTEAFDEKKAIGKIAVSVMRDGMFTHPKIIIENAYHMSYPCVFRYGDKVYMLPETSEAKTLELYEAVEFPCVWNKIVLKYGVIRVDTTVYNDKGEIYLISFDETKNVSELYRLNMGNYSLEHLQYRQHQEKLFRPGGGLFKSNGILYRPTQNCSQQYGGSLIIHRIRDLKNLDEERIGEYSPLEIGEGYDGLHTYNRCGEYETVDVFISATGFKCFMAKFKRKMHRNSIRNTQLYGKGCEV